MVFHASITSYFVQSLDHPLTVPLASFCFMPPLSSSSPSSATRTHLGCQVGRKTLIPSATFSATCLRITSWPSAVPASSTRYSCLAT